MPAYEIEIAPVARRQLEKFPAGVRSRLSERIALLGVTPRPSGCEKLVGSDHWRIRIGNYRVVYSLVEKESLVVVTKVAHRKEAYR